MIANDILQSMMDAKQTTDTRKIKFHKNFKIQKGGKQCSKY